MMTTAFKIDLMEPAMGMYELTSQRRTPTTIKTKITWIKGMISSFFCLDNRKERHSFNFEDWTCDVAAGQPTPPCPFPLPSNALPSPSPECHESCT
jgi:hypothetical protein